MPAISLGTSRPSTRSGRAPLLEALVANAASQLPQYQSMCFLPPPPPPETLGSETAFGSDGSCGSGGAPVQAPDHNVPGQVGAPSAAAVAGLRQGGGGAEGTLACLRPQSDDGSWGVGWPERAVRGRAEARYR